MFNNPSAINVPAKLHLGVVKTAPIIARTDTSLDDLRLTAARLPAHAKVRVILLPSFNAMWLLLSFGIKRGDAEIGRRTLLHAGLERRARYRTGAPCVIVATSFNAPRNSSCSGIDPGRCRPAFNVREWPADA